MRGEGMGMRDTNLAAVTEIVEQQGERRARIQLSNTNQHGQSTIVGEALVAIG